MSEPRARRGKHPRRQEPEGDPRFQVFGVWLVVRMLKPGEVPYQVECPRGQPIQYGVVVARGDGYDADAFTFRRMPPLGSIVAFEETHEGIEGHYFFAGDDEYRILHLDAVNVAFPPEGERQS